MCNVRRAENIPTEQHTTFLAFHRLVESTCQFEYLDVRKWVLWSTTQMLAERNRNPTFDMGAHAHAHAHWVSSHRL